MSSQSYIIDTSCLTQAHRVYYPFDIAPSFWNFMKHQFGNGSLLIINKVKDEIDWGNDALTNWVHAEIPAGLHIDCHANANIISHYGSIMVWGNGHPQYSPAAKTEFSEFDNADPFVVAAAIEKLAIVVSQEVSSPASKRSIKLPDICTQFGTNHIDTFTLLRRFGFRM